MSVVSAAKLLKYHCFFVKVRKSPAHRQTSRRRFARTYALRACVHNRPRSVRNFPQGKFYTNNSFSAHKSWGRRLYHKGRHGAPRTFKDWVFFLFFIFFLSRFPESRLLRRSVETNDRVARVVDRREKLKKK